MFQFVMKKTASTDLQGSTQTPRTSVEDIKLQKRKGMLTSYCAVQNYLLKTYPTNEQICTCDQAITVCKKQERMTPTAYRETQWTKKYRCGTAYASRACSSNACTSASGRPSRLIGRKTIRQKPTNPPTLRLLRECMAARRLRRRDYLQATQPGRSKIPATGPAQRWQPSIRASYLRRRQTPKLTFLKTLCSYRQRQKIPELRLTQRHLGTRQRWTVHSTVACICQSPTSPHGARSSLITRTLRTFQRQTSATCARRGVAASRNRIVPVAPEGGTVPPRCRVL